MSKEVNKDTKKRLLLKISLFILIIMIIVGGIFIYIIYTNLFDNSIPIVERSGTYVIDYTPPEDLIKADENEVQSAGQDEVIEDNTEPTEEQEDNLNEVHPVEEEIDNNPVPPTDEVNENKSEASTVEAGSSTGNSGKYSYDDDKIYASPKKQIPIYKKDRIDEDILNILLLGSDSRDTKIDRGRSDSMIVLSYNKTKNTAILLSLQRDTFIPIEEHGWNRINTTYFFGGVGLAINTINDLFDLDIQNYAIINFEGFINVVDKIGGVDVILNKAEAAYYNKNNGWKLKEGLNTLNGEQALVHSRNRTTGVDYDFGRTRRQRDVLLAIYKKGIELKDFATITSLIEFGLTKVSTNLPLDIIYSITSDLLSTDTTPEIITEHMPFKDTWKSVWYKKMLVIQIDIKENNNQIHELLY
jgi:LCP family protein required for cell wall assembly